MNQMEPRVCAVDIFCGAGGLTHGLLDAGIDVRAGYDVDLDCRFPYSYNNRVPFYHRDVTQLRSNEVLAEIPQPPNLIAGCAPCQPFSILTNKRKREDEDRAHLLKHFSRLVQEVRPTYVTMENVPGLRNKEVFASFVNTMKDDEYHVDYEVVDCSQYGVPQKRNRLVLLASRNGKIRVPSPTTAEPPRVEDAIGSLTKLGPGQADQDDPVHRSANLSEKNRRRISESKPGGTWEDWPDELVLACHKRRSGQSYKDAYGRMKVDEPAPTITTKFFNLGSGRFGHPEQDRALTPREAAILQTFDADYKFVPEGGEVRLTKLGELIGNAVPVKLGEAVGRALLKHAEESAGE